MAGNFFNSKKRSSAVFSVDSTDLANKRNKSDNAAAAEKTPPIKVLFVGDSGVGKTALATRLLNNTPPDASAPAESIRRNMLAHPAGKIDLTVFDVQGGYSNFMDIGSTFIHNADSIVFVYDVTDKESFDHISEWVKLVERTTDMDLPYVLIGTKADSDQVRVVDSNAARELAANLNMHFIETSAKTNSHIQEEFQPVLSAVIAEKIKRTEKERVASVSEVQVESEINEIRAGLNAELRNETSDFLRRKKVMNPSDLSKQDNGKYKALFDLQKNINTIANSYIGNKLYQKDKDWKQQYKIDLKRSIDITLNDKRLEKYTNIEKFGKKLQSDITILFSPLKHVAPGKWSYSAGNKSKEAVLEVKELADEKNNPITKSVKRKT